MRPDRIVVGECRGAEALDMIQAMNTGHAGSMTTVHANSAEEVVQRLELLMLMGAELPISFDPPADRVRAFDVIVHLDRLPDGRRVVSQVSEVTGVHPETTDVLVDGHFQSPQRAAAWSRPAGCRPSSMRWSTSNCCELEFLYGAGSG